MLRSLKAYPLLAGIRGKKPKDLRILLKSIVAIARLVDTFPSIQELDLNPIMVMEEGKGIIGVDARIFLSTNYKS